MTATDAIRAADVHAQQPEPVLAGALRLLADKPEVGLDVLAAAVVPEPAKDLAAVPAGFPELPKKIELTDEAKAALKRLPAVFGSVEIEMRRALTEAELARLLSEVDTLSALSPILGKRLEVIKETVRVHMDVAAENAGTAQPQPSVDPDTGAVLVPATPRDQNGHYLLAASKKPYQVQVGNVAWSQEYSASHAEPSSAALEKLLEDEVIDRKEWLALTRETRSLDTLKLLGFIRKNPARGLAILRMITRRTSAKSSLYLRKVK